MPESDAHLVAAVETKIVRALSSCWEVASAAISDLLGRSIHHHVGRSAMHNFGPHTLAMLTLRWPCNEASGSIVQSSHADVEGVQDWHTNPNWHASRCALTYWRIATSPFVTTCVPTFVTTYLLH